MAPHREFEEMKAQLGDLGAPIQPDPRREPA
jgi:hypothetical protein